MTGKLRHALPLAMAALAASEAAYPAVDMFLKIEGVEGESQDAVHKGEIDVLAWSWNVSQGNEPTGATGMPVVRDLRITKWTDLATTELTRRVLAGESSPSATLVVRSAGDTPVEFFRMDMQNVQISNVAQGGSSGDDRLTESVSLNFTTITITYTPIDAKGSPGEPVSYKYDITGNEAL